jgi:2-methylcitrate dehydratase PrpD
VAEPTVAAILGQFVADSRWQDLPDALRHEGKRSLLNFFGNAIGVAHDEAIDAAIAVLGAAAGNPEAAVIGRRERADIFTAAFVNAIGGNLLDYDDTHLRTIIHPTAPVAPAVLALGERLGRDGADVLHAFILGAEIECRLGNAVSPGHYARGWHITTTCGVFGAAAAAAKLLRLDAERTAHALGIAASQSSGLVENLTTAAKNVAVGNAARNGLLSALLAERGYQSAPTALEGKLGWARASGDALDVAEAAGALGERWEFATNTYKPYPCGIVFHSEIDAAIALRDRHRIAPHDIARVTVEGDSLLLERGDRSVGSVRDARVSLYHCAAVALLYGAAGIREFTPAVVDAREVADLRSRVVARLDARGSAQMPMTDREIEDKVSALVALGERAIDAKALAGAIWGLDRQGSVAALMMLAQPAATAR